MTRGRDPAAGDVLAIPIDDASCVIGQVVAKDHEGLFVAVYAGSYRSNSLPRAAEAVGTPLDILAWTVDALYFHGRWRRIGSAPVDPDVPFPAYRIRSGGRDVAEDFAGRRTRDVEPDLLRRLPMRTTFAPVTIESAAKGLHGAGPRDPEIDRLRPPTHDLTTRGLFDTVQDGRPGGDSGMTPGQRLRARLARTSSAEQPVNPLDWPTIEDLLRAGADLSRPRHTRHLLYFPSQDLAMRAKAMLQTSERSIQVQKVDGEHLLILEVTMVVNAQTIASLRGELEQMAAQYGGGYDGWEAEV